MLSLFGKSAFVKPQVGTSFALQGLVGAKAVVWNDFRQGFLHDTRVAFYGALFFLGTLFYPRFFGNTSRKDCRS